MKNQTNRSSLLLTGATGTIGKVLTDHLINQYNLVLVDKDISGIDSRINEQARVIECDLSNPDKSKGILEGIDYLIHLAGDPRPDADFYDSLLDANFKVTYNLFREASETEQLKRTVFASSIHAVGGYPLDTQVNVDMFPRPADLYGVSKAYMEVLASHLAFKYDKEFIGIRIGGFEGLKGEHETLENMMKYLSPEDMCQLVDCCLDVSLKRPFLLVNGVSDNTFKRLDITQAREEINYYPKDNAFDLYNVFKETEDTISNDDKK
ncbi:MAG: NAD(P)-dependent oxidoreductase [Alkalibacterium sp.]|nr:NAD(P)-dependent oxidoreductase [Alkalibacterium sp.]